MNKDKFVKSFVEKGDEICAYERIPLPEDAGNNFFLMEVKVSQHRKSYLLFSGQPQIANSRILIIDRRITVREFKLEIFKHFKPLLPNRGSAFKPINKDEEKKALEEEYAFYFENKNFSGMPIGESGNLLYTLQISNNLPLDQGMITSS